MIQPTFQSKNGIYIALPSVTVHLISSTNHFRPILDIQLTLWISKEVSVTYAIHSNDPGKLVAEIFAVHPFDPGKEVSETYAIHSYDPRKLVSETFTIHPDDPWKKMSGICAIRPKHTSVFLVCVLSVHTLYEINWFVHTGVWASWTYMVSHEQRWGPKQHHDPG